MNNKQESIHPILYNQQRIKQEGIVVLNGIKGTPYADKPFSTTDYVICIGNRGHMQLLYDGYPDHSEERTIGVIFPNHSVQEAQKPDKYLATLIVVHASKMNEPILQLLNQMRYRYEPYPCVKLNEHEYRMIMNIVELMTELSHTTMQDKHAIMIRGLDFLLRLLSFYRRQRSDEFPGSQRLDTIFFSNLNTHFREHRNVDFYAERANLSIKHFSAVIKQQTGHTVAYWIHEKVIREAKLLLNTHLDIPIQTIADMLGFDEQSTFSRYFRRETGLSPTQFRGK